ncbi:hypothetical protein [Roseateles sp.]|uniref:hypothetical protein n=1 Tax=Roseateles sp. TaxID=1971397 RepID=UPI0032630C16
MKRNPFRSLTVILGTAAALSQTPLTAHAQATSRLCSGTAGETPGPACLAAHQDIGALPPGPLYWSIYTFADTEAAVRARPPHGAVVQAFGRVWLFDIGSNARQLPGGRHVADVGPLPLDVSTGNVSVEYLKSTFSPGMTAPLHVTPAPKPFTRSAAAPASKHPTARRSAAVTGTP